MSNADALPTRPFPPQHVSVGYHIVALSHTITGKVAPNHACPIRKLEGPWNIHQLTRLNVIIEDMAQNYGLNSNNPTVNAYDILAVQPTTEKLFQAACSTFEVDIISLDFSTRMPFYLKHTQVGQAIERGIYFEICYSAGIRGELMLDVGY
ncbi:RNase P subunit p30-domain-containing protein [Jimgerdemannia flammicorona]|uniref:RNase P subunit p30-domain-containing protein n=1 Tax=Jimgerdemannia flammicorona TaxID=994334 RepID=A0A433A2T5_9FUNG|nr:RNase P subunit p30-domain-containing protein [Jimgerdemannia flammicorona]